MDVQAYNKIMRKKQQSNEDKKLTQRSLQVDLIIWNKARVKVGLFGSVSAVLRKLLRLWVEGKIDLDDYEE